MDDFCSLKKKLLLLLLLSLLLLLLFVIMIIFSVWGIFIIISGAQCWLKWEVIYLVYIPVILYNY